MDRNTTLDDALLEALALRKADAAGPRMPTFDHSLDDGALSPCPTCKAAMRAVSIDDEARRIAAMQHADALRAFTRNGRWGSCSSCPTDSTGQSYPELCKRFQDADHRLTLETLVDAFNERVKQHRAMIDMSRG